LWYNQKVNHSLTTEEAKRILRDEGYVNVYDWFDSPDFSYAVHDHPAETVIWVIEGSMDIDMPEGPVRLTAGDRHAIPARWPHSATMGPTGCQYVLGDKHTDD